MRRLLVVLRAIVAVSTPLLLTHSGEAAAQYQYPQECKAWYSYQGHPYSSIPGAGKPALDGNCGIYGGSVGMYCVHDTAYPATDREHYGCINTNVQQCGDWVYALSPPLAPQISVSQSDFQGCTVSSPADEGSAGKGNGTPPCPYCGGIGNPVNFATGNKFQREVDYAKTGDSLEFVRFYNSRGILNWKPLGSGWTHTWNRYIQMLSSTWYAYRPDGKAFKFVQVNGAWVGDADIPERLTAAPTGGGWQLTTRDDDVENYDANGVLQSITSRDGRTTTLTYSDGTSSPTTGGTYDQTSTAFESGLLIRVTDFQGRSLSFGYLNGTTMSSMTDPAGNVYRYTYAPYDDSNIAGANQNLVSVQYPDGNTRTYQYGEAGMVYNIDGTVASTVPAALAWSLTGITDNSVRFATFTYWTNGKARSTEHAGGVEKYSFPSSTSGSSTYTTPLGASQATTNTMILDVVRTTGVTQNCVGCGGSATETNGFDANGNVVSHVDFNGNLTCSTFDTTRDLETSRIEGLAGTTCTSPVATAATRTISTQWNANYRVPRAIAEPLRITTYVFNGDSGVSCAPAGASTALVCSKTVQSTADANGSQGFLAASDGSAPHVWSYTYNAQGQLLTVDGPRAPSDVLDVTTYSYYSTNDPGGAYRTGDLASITDALGHVTQFTNYDASGRLKRSVDPNGLETDIAYTPRGWVASRSIGPPARAETTSYQYDVVGSVTQVTAPDSSYVTYGYDAAHRLTDMSDGLGNHVHYTLDVMGNRIREQAYDVNGTLVRDHQRTPDLLNRPWKDIGGTHPATEITTNAYDNNGNLYQVTDALGRITTQSYDPRNRLTQVVDPFNGAAAPTKYGYNARDALTQVTDPRGLVTSYTYNGYGDLLALLSPDTGTTSFTSYDTASNLKSKTDSRGVSAAYTYDALNRVKTITYPDQTVTYTYDACANGIGRLCGISDNSGSIAYTYDAKGRVTTKSQVVAGISHSLTITYGYNSAGQLSTITTPGGRVLTYTYANNRPVSISVNGAELLHGAFYEPFGPNGGWVWSNGSTHARVFDLDFRPSSVESAGTPGPIFFQRTYAWDDVSNLTSITDGVAASLSSSHTYDVLNRLTGFTQGSTAQAYTYDGLGNRLSDPVASYVYSPTSNRLVSATGAQTFNYTFDPAGNQLSDGRVTWTFGGNNRATSAQSNVSGLTATFLVNALGQRVMKSVASTGAKTIFVYDESGRLSGEYDATGAPLTEHVWLEDLPVGALK